MKRGRFSEEQVVKILKEQEQGQKVGDICRRHGIGEATFYKWKSKYGGMSVSDVQRLKSLEAENRRLKTLLADAHLDLAILHVYYSYKYPNNIIISNFAFFFQVSQKLCLSVSILFTNNKRKLINNRE